MKNFRTLYGQPIPNIVEYIKDYLSAHENVDILIGCDSQHFNRNKTVYGIVVVLYTRGKGGHVLCYKDVDTSVKYMAAREIMATRLINEVWKSIEIADYLTSNGLPKPEWIDIDLNPDPKYKSNTVLRQAIGLVEGMGYKPRWKKNGAMVTYAANYLARH